MVKLAEIFKTNFDDDINKRIDKDYIHIDVLDLFDELNYLSSESRKYLNRLVEIYQSIEVISAFKEAIYEKEVRNLRGTIRIFKIIMEKIGVTFDFKISLNIKKRIIKKKYHILKEKVDILFKARLRAFFEELDIIIGYFKRLSNRIYGQFEEISSKITYITMHLREKKEGMKKTKDHEIIKQIKSDLMIFQNQKLISEYLTCAFKKCILKKDTEIDFDFIPSELKMNSKKIQKVFTKKPYLFESLFDLASTVNNRGIDIFINRFIDKRYEEMKQVHLSKLNDYLTLLNELLEHFFKLSISSLKTYSMKNRFIFLSVK